MSKHRFDRSADRNNGAKRRQREDHRGALMPLSAFYDEAWVPSDAVVGPVLGRAHDAWTQLLGQIKERIGPVTEAWKYSAATTGWALRILRQDRVLLYMTPQPRQFVVSLALGERAVAAARPAGISADLLAAIESAPRFPEGRGIRIVVRDGRDFPSLMRLAQIKARLSR